MKKHKLFTLIGFAISVVLLYFSLRETHFNEIWSTMRKANVALAFLPLVFIGTAISLSSFRWSRVAGKAVRFREAFTAMLIGMFVNNVLPLRLGEVARGYVLSRKKGLSFTYSCSTVALDRFFDLTGLLLLTLTSLVLPSFPRSTLPGPIYDGIYVVLGVLVFFILLIILLSRQSLSERLSKRFVPNEKSFLSRLTKRVVEVQDNLRRIGSPLTIVFFVIMSFCSWFSMSMGLYVVTRALGVSVPFACIPFVCAMLNFGITIPSSPGYVGVYQALIVYLLSIFGVSKSEGFAVSILYHASWYVPYTVVGFAFSLREHLKIGDVRKLEDVEEKCEA
jgi:uncharacterized protein (TIRG00374 family)